MQQITSETQAALKVTGAVGGRRSSQWRESTGRKCEQMSNSNLFATRSCQSTQCFICSRIYFDQSLRKCPHCNSNSVQHFTTDDLSHFARGPVQEPFGGATRLQEEEQVLGRV